jgi:uncharacterized membrane-anchored protein YitT (DUF2179 family)
MKNKFALWSFVLSLVVILLIAISLILNTPFILIYNNIGSFLIEGLSTLIDSLIIPAEVLSIVFGIIGIKKSKEKGGKKFAIIGLIISILVIFSFLAFILYITSRPDIWLYLH